MGSISTTASRFASAPYIPPDAIFALTAEYLADSFPKKVNLGQGAYRDSKAQPWVLPSVARSRQLIIDKGLQHEYLPILGLAQFREKAAELALGPQSYAANRNKIATCQTLSGTGALHLAGRILASCQPAASSRKVYIPEPTWSNHHLVFSTLGFDCQTFRYYDPAAKTLDMDSYRATLDAADPGSIVVLHACAHNPTGLDPTPAQWREIGAIMKQRGLFPLFDAAYLGFNSGDLDQDAFAIRHFVTELELEAAVCLSFAKNMGLYELTWMGVSVGERVGCLVLATASADIAVNSQSLLESLQRSEISNPPAFGARIAAGILADEGLRGLWAEDLKTMSGRIQSMRRALHEGLVRNAAPGNWDHLLRQSGMFGFLGLSAGAVKTLKEKHHIYMAGNSRISIAGLNADNVAYVARSIAKVLEDEK
ncbi:pyridoxal phosphate-dependent transferase [Aspergillus ambiguus]|uniref:pyridoxal phosphate-dependent transferase n=1 Tax=Aspergillus ambiguus TaxID=176160 RepID=UPI003CCDAB23